MNGQDTAAAAALRFGGPFSFSQLLVAAWKLNPTPFSFPDNKKFPDARKLQNILYGKRGLIARRLILQTTPPLFICPATEDNPARQPAPQIPLENKEDSSIEDEPSRPILPPILIPIWISHAFFQFSNGRKETLSFKDVLAALSIPAKTTPSIARARIGLCKEACRPFDLPQLREINHFLSWVLSTFRPQFARTFPGISPAIFN